MLNNYSLRAVGSIVEFGKRGGSIEYDQLRNSFSFKTPSGDVSLTLPLGIEESSELLNTATFNTVIGSVLDLNTLSKDSIVDAINELCSAIVELGGVDNGSGGFRVGSDELAGIVKASESATPNTALMRDENGNAVASNFIGKHCGFGLKNSDTLVEIVGTDINNNASWASGVFKFSVGSTGTTIIPSGGILVRYGTGTLGQANSHFVDEIVCQTGSVWAGVKFVRHRVGTGAWGAFISTNTPPINTIYVRYPSGANSAGGTMSNRDLPANVFPNTSWVKINYDGAFFRDDSGSTSQTFGTAAVQGDTIREITGTFRLRDDNSTSYDFIGDVSGAFEWVNAASRSFNPMSSGSTSSSNNVGGAIRFKASNSVSVSTEVRPKNRSVQYWLRLS